MSRAREFADLASSADAGGITGKNLIINGAMQVAQRGTSFNGAGGYKLDRFHYADNTDDTIAITQYTITTGGETGLPIQFTNAMKIAITGGSTGTVNDLRQRIEFPERFLGQTLTLSYYAKASANTTAGISASSRITFDVVSNAPAITYLPARNLTTTWQRFEHTFTLGTSSTMTTDNSSYLNVTFASLIINTTVDIYITGVQLEVGEQATPFEHRSYGDELARCQRYYEQMSGGGGDMVSGVGQAFNSSSGETAVIYKVEKRVAPTITTSGSFQIWLGNGSASATSNAFAEVRTTQATWQYGGASSGSVGQAIQFYADGGTATVKIDAEL